MIGIRVGRASIGVALRMKGAMGSKLFAIAGVMAPLCGPGSGQCPTTASSRADTVHRAERLISARQDARAQCRHLSRRPDQLAYKDGVFARFRDYLRLRRHLYGLERRWPQAPFWRNRLA